MVPSQNIPGYYFQTPVQAGYKPLKRLSFVSGYYSPRFKPWAMEMLPEQNGFNHFIVSRKPCIANRRVTLITAQIILKG